MKTIIIRNRLLCPCRLTKLCITSFKSGLRRDPELIKVYEKLSRGIWSYKGVFARALAKFSSFPS